MLPICYMGAPPSDYVSSSFCAFLHCYIFVLETGSCYVVKAGFHLTMKSRLA